MNPSVRPARQESRARILAVLREAGRPVGISALSHRTGLSAGAVRFHLANLMRAGAIGAVHPRTHPGPGRPVVEYESLSPAADDPAQAYRTLAALLGRHLEKSTEPRAAYEAGRQWAREAPPPQAHSATGARDVMGALLRRGGFRPVLSADGETIELHHCPYRELAAELPSVVCAVHEGLAAGALESAGVSAKVRVVPILDGSGPCRVHLQHAPQPADVSDSCASNKEILP